MAAFLPIPLRSLRAQGFCLQDAVTGSAESSLLKLQRASAFEIYDHPGGYTQKGDGQQLTRLRMEEHEAAYHTVAGASICASFFAGGKFTMARHHLQAEENQEYVLQRVTHRASDYTYITAGMGPPSYDNTFEAFPAATKFRPAGRTHWPTVQGPQTTTVVGPGVRRSIPTSTGG